MILTDLYDDVYTLIYEYLDHKSSLKLTVTCKRFYEYGLANGFYKKFQFYPDFGYLKSIKILADHYRTIRKLTIDGIEDPDLWIPDYPKITHFNNCKLTVLDPPFIAKTEIIYVKNNGRKYVKINRQKFPRLRKVYFVY